MAVPLLNHRLLFVLGKGGVGRSAVSGALALAATRQGKRTLLIEADLQTPIASAYGQHPGYDPVELASGLWGMALDGQKSLEQYLSLVVPGPVLHAVFATSLYKYFVQAAPAVRELLMMGKVYHEIELRPDPQWGMVVFDAPASGQALSMLRMPFAARETFGESVVGREARNVENFFRTSGKCAFVGVTTAEPLPMSETLEFNHALHALGLGLAAVAFNRVSSASFENADVSRMLRRGSHDSKTGDLRPLAEIARQELRRRARERRALTILRRQIECATIRLKERRGITGRQLIEDLADQLAGSDEPGEAKSTSDESIAAD